MSEPAFRAGSAKRPAWLAWLIVPLLLAPLVLAFRGSDGARFFVLFGAICIAAPCAGFWWGEMRGRSFEGRAARGCFVTLALFAGYVFWALIIVPVVLKLVRQVPP